MKPHNLKFKIETATVKATTLKNAVNLSILIHNDGQNPAIDRKRLRNIVRELTGNPEGGLVPGRFIIDLHLTPKYSKVNVTVLFHAEMTKKEIKQRIREAAMWIIEELCAGS